MNQGKNCTTCGKPIQSKNGCNVCSREILQKRCYVGFCGQRSDTLNMCLRHYLQLNRSFPSQKVRT